MKVMNQSRDKIDKYFITFIWASLATIIILGMFRGCHRRKLLREDGVFTTGTIIATESMSEAGWGFTYEYIVNNKVYKRTIQSSVFICEGRNFGCVGNTYRVIYSKSDPSVCDIDLGEHNEAKGLNALYFKD